MRKGNIRITLVMLKYFSFGATATCIVLYVYKTFTKKASSLHTLPTRCPVGAFDSLSLRASCCRLTSVYSLHICGTGHVSASSPTASRAFGELPGG